MEKINDDEDALTKLVINAIEGEDYVRVFNAFDYVFSDEFEERRRKLIERINKRKTENVRNVSRPSGVQ